MDATPPRPADDRGVTPIASELLMVSLAVLAASALAVGALLFAGQQVEMMAALLEQVPGV